MVPLLHAVLNPVYLLLIVETVHVYGWLRGMAELVCSHSRLADLFLGWRGGAIVRFSLL